MDAAQERALILQQHGFKPSTYGSYVLAFVYGKPVNGIYPFVYGEDAGGKFYFECVGQVVNMGSMNFVDAFTWIKLQISRSNTIENDLYEQYLLRSTNSAESIWNQQYPQYYS